MWLTDILRQSWLILLDSGAYVLVGFVVAALLNRFLAGGFFVDALRKRGARSVWLATLIGGPLDLCSCSVLPAAMALHRRGVSKGATIAFMISTPELSFSAFMLTYALLGGWMAVIRPIAACITALVAGFAQNWLENRQAALAGAVVPSEAVTDVAPPPLPHTCADGHTHDDADPLQPKAQPPTFREGFRYAFVDIFDDVFAWMLAGILVAGMIQAVIPEASLLKLLGNPWIAMLVLAAIGIPMYVCAEASTPIAAAFVGKGVAPGAGLVFLLCGPASNFGSIIVVARQLGRQTVIVYLASIAVVALAVGAAVNVIAANYPIIALGHAPGSDWMPESAKLAGAVIFLVLCVASALRRKYPAHILDFVNSFLPAPMSPRTARGLTAMVVIALYLLSGFAIVGPDETGVVRRFGRITQASAAPGLYFVGPWPVGRMDLVRVEEVRRISLGEFKTEIGATIDEKTAWMWMGDQNVASLTYVVQWDVSPQRVREFAYGVRDAERLVRVATVAAVREILSTGTIDSIYTTARPDAERRAAARAQTHCDQAVSGIHITGIRFQSVHAPADVHEAFRDVASALEDKATRIDQALGEQARVIPLARGNAQAALSDAESYSAGQLAAARGEASAFIDMHAAAAAHDSVTRTRLYFEMLDKVLPTVRKYLRVGDANGRALELWFRGEKTEPSTAVQP